MSKKSADRLGKAMRFKTKVDNKMRGAYGYTDFDKKVIAINKKRSKKDPLFKHPKGKRTGKYPDVLATIVHELHHAKHPKASEAATLKHERNTVGKLSKKQKKRLYAKFS